MRVFILVLVLEMVAVYSIAGFGGCVAVLLFLVVAVSGMLVYHERQWRNDTDTDGDCLTDGEERDLGTDPTNDTADDANPVTLFAPTDGAFADLLAELGATAGALMTTVLVMIDKVDDDDDSDCDGLTDNEVKFLPIRRNRGQSWMGNEDRRSLRLHPDNSWKQHRRTQWR